MSIKIMVIDMTGQKKTPNLITLEGKISPIRLKELALNALGIPNPLHFYYKIEIKDKAGNIVERKITSECRIFVKNPSDPFEVFGFPNPFK